MGLQKSVFIGWAAASLAVTCISHALPVRLAGIDLQPWELDADDSYGSSHSLETIKGIEKLSGNAVGIRHYLVMPEINEPSLTDRQLPGSTEQDLRNVIRQIEGQGLVPFLTIGLEVEDPSFKVPGDTSWQAWHGAIELQTPKDLDSWFAKYTELVGHYAQVAGEEKVPIFSIGNELVSMTETTHIRKLPPDMRWILLEGKAPRIRKYAQAYLNARLDYRKAHPIHAWDLWMIWRTQFWFHNQKQSIFIPPDIESFLVRIENDRRADLERRWRDAIARIRAIYNSRFAAGQLTMNANQDQFMEVGFWDALDFISVNAYWPLTPTNRQGQQKWGPTDTNSLKGGWDKVFRHLSSSWRDLPLQQQKPIIISEVGLTRMKYSAAVPWASSGDYCLDFSGDPSPPSHSCLDFAKRPDDPTERARAYQALTESEEEWKNTQSLALKGLFFWNAYPTGHQAVDAFSLLSDPTDPVLDPLHQVLFHFIF